MGVNHFARPFLAALPGAVIALTLTFAVADASAKPACHEGVHAFGSAKARTFCGPAQATVKVDGRSFTLKGGACDAGSGFLTINLGTIVIGKTSRTKPDYFGITVGDVAGGEPAAGDGVYTDGVVSYVRKHRSASLSQASVTLKGKRTRGSFSGTLVPSGKPVTGTFHC